MSLVEVLPDVQTLTRAEKLRLIQILAQELAEEASDPLIKAGESYPVWSPDRAFDAAAAMMSALEED